MAMPPGAASRRAPCVLRVDSATAIALNYGVAVAGRSSAIKYSAVNARDRSSPGNKNPGQLDCPGLTAGLKLMPSGFAGKR